MASEDDDDTREALDDVEMAKNANPGGENLTRPMLTTKARVEDGRRTFSVIAPSDLRGGYHLAVRTRDGKDLVVRVPKPGVWQHQEFQGKECGPIMNDWSDDEFSCMETTCCAEEGLFWLLAHCCPVIAWASILKKLGLNACGCAGGPFMATCTAYFLAVLIILNKYIIGSISLSLFFFACIVFVGTVARVAVRKKYKIPGWVFMDCICVLFCHCCAAMHSFRHMKRSGDTPMNSCGRQVFATEV